MNMKRSCLANEIRIKVKFNWNNNVFIVEEMRINHLRMLL